MSDGTKSTNSDLVVKKKKSGDNVMKSTSEEKIIAPSAAKNEQKGTSKEGVKKGG